jgi:hypothetical protein
MHGYRKEDTLNQLKFLLARLSRLENNSIKKTEKESYPSNLWEKGFRAGIVMASGEARKINPRIGLKTLRK